MPPLTVGKQYSAQHQSLLVQQFNGQSLPPLPELGLEIGLLASDLNSVHCIHNRVQSTNSTRHIFHI
ncbi:hypothetical protein OROGR_017385 [Orobanche gracilis]